MDPQAAAAVDAAVASGELHRVAAILDAAELEARLVSGGSAGPA
jgi:hypothetical protein